MKQNNPSLKTWGTACAAPDASVWNECEWISAADAQVAGDARRKLERAADGTSWFFTETVNARAVKKAVWCIASLGVCEIFVNGKRIGEDALKPGFTHAEKTKYAFTYDVTDAFNAGAGEKNVLAAETSSGWWAGKIISYAGKKTGIRGALIVEYADGATEVFGTRAATWKAGVAGPVTHAGIFDGEEYDARIPAPLLGCAAFANAERNDEFKGEIFFTAGAEVCRRYDKAMQPVSAYAWKGVTGAADDAAGTIVKVRDYDPCGAIELKAGETLVVDFGQNAAAVPAFTMRAKPCTVLTCLPGEMLNDGNGDKSRGCDGPCGSVYRGNLRMPERGMRAVYTFAENGGASVFYMPRHTFFGYRYISVTATDDVTIEAVESVPVTSIAKKLELGSIETGEADVNKLISNVYWGQLSNYLSVTTDCPQRNERLGWTADTQVFVEAGSFNAYTYDFFVKWMRDERDSQHEKGGFPGVAPRAQYGNEPMRLGWADAGVIVPYKIWKQFGKTGILRDNWAAMERYMAHVDETKYETAAIREECGNYQWADWLSYEAFESCGGGAFQTVDGKWGPKPEAELYWNYLGACYWMWDALMMAEMGAAIGEDAAKYREMAARAKAYLKATFFTKPDGTIRAPFDSMQTPALFALMLGLVEGDAKTATIEGLKRNFKDHGDCLQTGFLGTSILMETLTANGMSDIAYTLLLQHKNPSWLYSVDQGATTIWERWNSYRKDVGFASNGMNSFNHYAYGAVLAWIYKCVAGIATDPAAPGYKRLAMAPKPDRRIGYVKASYNSASGLVKSAWRYEGAKWIWEFTVPAGVTALVTLPDGSAAKEYAAGDHKVELDGLS